MPSLRRSLILYFLALVGLVLGALGLLIDRFAADALDARLESETRRIDNEYKSDTAAAAEKFDEELLTAARSLAREYRDKMWSLTSEFSGQKVADHFNIAMLVQPLGTGGNGWATSTAALYLPVAPPRGGRPGPPPPLTYARWQLFGQYYSHEVRVLAGKVRNELQVSADHPDFYQLNVVSTDRRDRQLIRSPKQPFALAARFDGMTAADGLDHLYDDLPSLAGGKLRRVRYRSSYSIQVRPPFGFPYGRGDRGGRPDPQGYTGPQLYVQVAQPKTTLAAYLAGLAAARDAQLTTAHAETTNAQSLLRWRIGAIGGSTFLAVVFGGWLLTGVGLAPLRKLSDAVSRVTEKDFRLSVEKDDLTTELAPIHDRLTHSLDALRRAFEREKEAIADISHELRTPVAGLLATLDVSLRKPRTAEQYKETMTECRAITKQLGNLVERVMTLAYLDAGPTSAQPVPVNVSELADGCAAVIRPLATAHGLTLKTDLPPAVEFTTDPDRLREVLMNLLHNAVEYNKPGGVITLRAARDKAGLMVEVADTGIGMTDDVKAKIFDRFFRADPSRTATGVHAGLGLAIVKESVGRMGGSIAVDSTPAAGSSFRVRLPG